LGSKERTKRRPERRRNGKGLDGRRTRLKINRNLVRFLIGPRRQKSEGKR